YVVTADHVVNSKEPDAPPAKIRVQLFDRQGDPIEAKLRTHDVGRDLAVITFPAPDGFHWNARSLSSEAHPRDVWFVGRSRTWYVPTDAGHVSDDEPVDARMDIESRDVRPGSSGGPLIAASGIVGMLVNDSAEGAQALSIAAIKSLVARWNHPWTAETMARTDLQAVKGERIAAIDPLTAALREQQPEGAARHGFDLGMAVAEGQTERGPGKRREREPLPTAGQAS